MSGIADHKLSAPKRLDLLWYPEEHPPRTRSRGRGPGFDYRGTVFVDNVRVSGEERYVQRRQWVRKRRDLQREHGFRVDETVERLTETVQTGRLLYEDGTEMAYRGELLDDGTLLLTIDDEHFTFGDEAR